MTYLEARNSGYPFNRSKYKDGWYKHDFHRDIDYAMIDLSQRFWTKDDLESNDWCTVRGTGIDMELELNILNEIKTKKNEKFIMEQKWFYLYCMAVSLIITLLLACLTVIASTIIHLALFIINM